MAKYTPNGWKMSAAGERRFNELHSAGVVDGIVRKHIRKYNLPARGADDLMQEGRLAAAYAIDTYQPTRGKLEGYISRVVFNALGMVASEALTQSRQPHKMVQEQDGKWRKVPVGHVELEHDMAVDDSVDPSGSVRERSNHLSAMAASMEERLAQLVLSSDARRLLQIRLQTPPELWILSRNINRGRWKLEMQCVCLYLGWMLSPTEYDRGRYQRAARDLREQFRFMLGIDDQTFEPLKPIIVDTTALQAGAKCRNLQELRP